MRKHNYLIGYEGEGQCIYGKNVNNLSRFCELMTLFQAKQMAKKTYSHNNRCKSKTVVYKLIKVKE